MTDQTKPGSLRRSLLLFMGCGCVYPMVFLIIIIPLAFFLLADPVKQIITTPPLLQFSAPGQEHFWSLQEKLLDMPSAAESTDGSKPQLILSHAEFNAFLSGRQYPPAGGIVIHRIRFAYENGRGALYFFCSGFFMRNLVITLQFDKPSEPAPGDVLINSRLAIKDSWLNRKVIGLIIEILNSRQNDTILKIIKETGSWSFDDQNISLSASLL